MGLFDDMGVVVHGLSDNDSELLEGNAEEIFRFSIFITEEQDIEIGVNVLELAIDDIPEFGEQYSFLAHTFAELVIEHIGMNTEFLMNAVSELTPEDIELSEEEKAIMNSSDADKEGAVLLYTFPVLIMAEDENNNGTFDSGEMQLGVGFEKSPKAELMAKVYGDEYLGYEETYQEIVSDSILDHGTLFVKAVESIQKV